MFFNLLFILITTSFSKHIEGIDCFILSENIQSQGTQITVTGQKRMCDCLDKNQLLQYHPDTTEVIFLENVQYIGAKCFKNLRQLTKITFGSNVKEIGFSC